MLRAISQVVGAMRRSVLAAALAVVALGAWGQVAAAQAQQAAGLSPARYAALDAVYVASLPLDGNPTAAERW